MVPTICAVGETSDNTTVDTSPSTPAPATRNKLSTPNLGSAESSSSNFVGYLPTEGLSPGIAQIIRASWRVSTQSAYNTTVRRWLEFCKRWQLNPYQPTVSQALDFLHTLYELGLSYNAIGTHWSAISAIVEIPGVPQLGEHWLVPRFMKGICHLGPPQPRYTKTCDVNKVLSYLKSLGPNDSLSLKQLTLKTAALLTILAGRQIHTLHMLSVIHMGQSLDKVIFHVIGLTKCSKRIRPNQPVIYRAYVEDMLLSPVKCIYAYSAQRSEIFTQDFTKFHYFWQTTPSSIKNLLAWWVKEVMGNSGIDTEIFQPHSTRVASNSAVHKLGMSLQEVLQRGEWSNASTFFTYYFRKIEDSLNLDEQQHKWWVIFCNFVYMYIVVS